MTAKEFLQKTATRLTPNEINDVTTTLHFDFGSGENYSLVVADGKADFQESFVGTPECIIKADADDFVKIATGDMNPMMAMMMGKIKISNPGAMMKYAKILGLM
ncbi:Sterol-binding domain protein [Emticicia oligotrophica DSM 17448]|uniref:Sterol-binding domain protein n=1 Tax=Emticicia oligotrophica (strain DSM 17448 / CIP 109782 / MTCC 6937 / GPTSA100-15) TaxID=929562 RepID=A0ABN4AKZ1_EMTOG|nr:MULTISPECIES: SCP2 sterol-binding domain-containing protein [Emticicia]AFK02988.1 Sterol-binding domain protein [Emticicia oligotrophica DSM 17448]